MHTGAVAGIIAAGQPSHPAILEKSPAPAWFGAAGRHDFNYRDTRDIRTRLPRGADVRTEFFDGVHQWLSPEVAMRAVGWLEMLAIRDGRRAADAAFVRETLERDTRHTAALEAASRLVEAAETYQALVRAYDGVTSIDELRARLAATTSAPAHRTAVKEEERAARFERSHATNTARTLVHLFGTGRLLHARGLLNQLRVETLQRDAARGGAMGDAARRALEHIFVQTAFYLPDDLQAKGRHSQAATLLEVATAIHPSRPAPWYALAQARAQAGRVDGAFEALDRAVDAGFTDAARMEADAAFDRLREDER